MRKRWRGSPPRWCARRIVAALDRLLLHEMSAGVHALLRRVDADQYRDAVRDAVLAGDRAKLVELAGKKAALEQPPGFVAGLGEYGGIPVERRRQLLQVAVSQRSGDLGLLMTLGNTYLINQKAEDEWLRWFQAAVAAAPANAAAHSSLGLALNDKGELDEAIAWFQKAIALDPKDANAHNYLGAVLCDVKRDTTRPSPASARPSPSTRSSPRPTATWAMRWVPRARWTRPSPATTRPSNSTRSTPSPPLNLGVILCDVKRDYDEAIACFRKAIDLDPKNAYGHHNLGVALKGKGQVDEAIACFQKAIALDPKYAKAHSNLGVALRRQGGVRRGHRLLPQGHRPRPEVRLGPQQPGQCAEGQGPGGRGHRLLQQGHRPRPEVRPAPP